MVVMCSFKNCQKTPIKDPGAHFYHFPRDENRCQAWVKAANNPKLLYRLCDSHFQDWCFMNINTKHRLVHNAVPNAAKPASQYVEKPAEAPSGISTSHSSLLHQLLMSSGPGNTPQQPCQHTPPATPTLCNVAVMSSQKPVVVQSGVGTSTHSSLLHQLLTSSEPAPKSPLSTQTISVSDETCTPTVSSENQAGCSLNDSLHRSLVQCSTPKSSNRRYTPKKLKMASTIKKQNDVLRRLRSKYNIVKKRIKNSNTLSLKNSLLNEGVKSKLASFIERQVELSVQRSSNKRYTHCDKINAYRIYCKSRAAYNVLREVLELPTERTLKRFVSSKLCSTGLDTEVFRALKKVLEKKKSREKVFALVYDEISLKPCLMYCKAKDCVIGFQDLGGGNRSELIANQAMVLMLRSLNGRKKLPLGFFFSRKGVPPAPLKEILLGALTALENAGAEVEVLVCDQGFNTSSALKRLGVRASKPYFFHNGKKVYGLYDPPHLLKNLRKSLMNYDLKTSQGIVSFKHIVDFYEIDKKAEEGFRAAYKLTNQHIYVEGFRSMRVKLAAQIFSQTVAAAMNLCLAGGLIKAEAKSTVSFVRDINNLFDTCNGTSKIPVHGNAYRCAASHDSPHKDFWIKMLSFIESWEFIKPTESESGRKRKQNSGPQQKEGWTTTLNALMLLSEEMLLNQQYFMTKRCNQDCLENFFSRIRGCGGNRINPSAYEFCSAYRIASVNSFKSVSKSSNCEPDDDEFMFFLLGSESEAAEKGESSNGDALGDAESCDDSLIIDTDVFSDDKIIDTDNVSNDKNKEFEALEFLSQNTIAYIAGYVAKRVLCLLKKPCNTCEGLLIDKGKPLLQHSIYLHFKEYKDVPNAGRGLMHPTVAMVKCIAALKSTATTYFKASLTSAHLLRKLENVLIQLDALSFLNCPCHTPDVKRNIVNISSLLFLKIHLRDLNRNIDKTTVDLKKLRGKKRKM